MTPQLDLQGWQLDESGAADYERFLVPAVMEPWAIALLAEVAPRPGQRVLDVACGTGIVARHAAGQVGTQGEVVGIDINPAMLAVARDRVTDGQPPIRWKEAAADDLPFPDASFDVVLCQQGLQFFPDRPAALGDMRRVAAPGAQLGVVTCGPIDRQPVYQILAEVVTRHVGVQAGQVIASPYALGDPTTLRTLLTDAGLRDVHVHRAYTSVRVPSAAALLQGETSSSPLGDLVAALDDVVVDELVHDLRGALAAWTDDDGIVFPFETLVATALR